MCSLNGSSSFYKANAKTWMEHKNIIIIIIIIII